MKRNKGFTLIELLVSIMIIAIFSVIAISFGAALWQTKDAQTSIDVRDQNVPAITQPANPPESSEGDNKKL